MERYQVLLEPEQRRRLERLARRQHRSAASVLRQALGIGLNALEGTSEVWERRMDVLARARVRLGAFPPIQEDLIDAVRQEHEQDRQYLWDKPQSLTPI